MKEGKRIFKDFRVIDSRLNFPHQGREPFLVNVVIGSDNETLQTRPDIFNEVRRAKDELGVVAGLVFITKESVDPLITTSGVREDGRLSV